MSRKLPRILLLLLGSTGYAEAYGKSNSFRPGIDISSSSASGSLAFDDYCRPTGVDPNTGVNTAECWSPNEAMGTSSPSVSLFLQKPLKSRYFLKVFHFDYGIALPLMFYNLTNDPDKNKIRVYSVDAEGNIDDSVEVQVDAMFLGVLPNLYVQAGLTVPYLPWILFTLGGGPELMYGRIMIDKSERVTVQSLKPGLFTEMEVIVLRTRRLNFSLYARALSNILSDEPDPLKVTEGEDRNYRFESATVNLGIRFHFP
ncbi:hypothetical protein [Oligoflexus tunisiensis]|uniref:hypothetical protein n=1 Tax=Oligoflexus tunisiensis TaxID=708132 RepID=UPI00114CB610|nr:hypothetical protein [Oligoflexus tunisiensis]